MSDRGPLATTSSSDDIIWHLSRLSSAEAESWVLSNLDTLTAQQAKDILNGFYGQGGWDRHGGSGNDSTHLPSSGPIWDKWQAVKDLDAKASAAAVSSDLKDLDLDGSGTVDASERAAVEKAKNTIAADKAKKDGTTVASERAALDVMPMPDLLKASFSKAPSPETLQALIDKWNEYHVDPALHVHNQDELYTALGRTGDPMAAAVVDAVKFGSDPITNYKVKLRDGSTVDVFEDDLKVFRGADPLFNTKQLTHLVRLADQLGWSNVSQDGSKVTHWLPLAYLARGVGGRAMQAITEPGIQRTSTGEPRPGLDPKIAKQYAKDQAARGKYIDQTYAIVNAGVQYTQNLKVYNGNVGLAMIATFDPSLAAKMSVSKPGAEDTFRANNLLATLGLITEEEAMRGGGTQFLNPAIASSNGGGAGATRSLPDPVALKQTARDMFKGLFLMDPTDEQLNQFTAQVQGVISGASSNQQVDGGARLRDILENNALYKEFYGRSGGLSDGQYQAQFQQGAQSMLGAEAADASNIRSGMRDGNYQTTIGAVAGSKKAWGNSSFLGRLAQAATVVNENT